MALSRFYRPTNYEYMSQFVPKNLEIMDRGLQRAQAKQDKQVGKLDELNSMILKQNALEGYDTEVRDQIVGEVKSFSEEMANTDLTSPENFRKVNQFVQSMANDERIQKLNMGLASKAKYDKIKEDLVTKGDYATENDRIFAQSYDAYLKQPTEDSKFAIDYIGGKELIEKNAPARPELEKLVDNMRANSITKDRVTGEWINRSTDKVLSYDELMGVLGSNINSFYQTKEGRQMARRAEMNGVSFQDQFLSEIEPVAQERAYEERSRTTRSNTAHLLNKKKLEAQEIPLVTQPLNTILTTHGVTSLIDYDNKIKEFRTLAAQNPTSPEGIKARREAEYLTGNRDKMLNTLIASGNLDKNEMGVLKMNYQNIENSPNLIKQMYTASFPMEVMDGNKPLEYYQSELKKLEKQQPGYLDQLSKVVVAQSLGLDYANIEKKIDDAIAKGVGTEKQEVLLPVERQGDKKKIALATTTLLDNFNFQNADIKTDEKEEIDFAEVSKYVNPSTISLVREDGRVGIKFSTKAIGDELSKNYEVFPKATSIKELSSAFKNFLSAYAGNKADYNALEQEYESSQFRPVGRNSLYSQTSDMGLDSELIGDWNIQYPQAGESQNGVVLNNPTYGVLTYDKAIEHVNTFNMSADSKAAIIRELAKMNPRGEINKNNAAVFSSPILAKRFLEDVQTAEQNKQSNRR